MPEPFSSAALFLINLVFTLYVYILLVRLLLQIQYANYYNPISQLVIKLTNPIVKPLQRILPGIKGIDFAILVPIYILSLLRILIVTYVGYQTFPQIIGMLLWGLTYILDQLADVFFFSLIIGAILSWVQNTQTASVAEVMYLINKPILNPLRRLIPTFSGMDFTPLIGLVLIKLIDILVINPLLTKTMMMAIKH